MDEKQIAAVMQLLDSKPIAQRRLVSFHRRGMPINFDPSHRIETEVRDTLFELDLITPSINSQPGGLSQVSYEVTPLGAAVAEKLASITGLRSEYHQVELYYARQALANGRKVWAFMPGLNAYEVTEFHESTPGSGYWRCRIKGQPNIPATCNRLYVEWK